MPVYTITAPNGKSYSIEGPEGATREEVVAEILRRDPSAANPPPKQTIAGNVKEFAKGVVPGAVGLAETAAIGASALLPDDKERAVRDTIKSVADTAKAPFAPAAGYEDAVGRKLGEGVGSVAPFLAMGPLGLAARAAVGTGVGLAAGAGEARVRAERDGATADQRATATALGMIPGAIESLPPFRILDRLPDAAKSAGMQMIRRAAISGGEEAAQEAAQQFAQNLIAKGIYKPEQSLTGEVLDNALVGGGVGALTSALLDAAVGRRARTTTQTDATQKALEARVLASQEAAARAQEPALKAAKPGAQGQLWEDIPGPRPQAAPSDVEAEAAGEVDPAQMGFAFDDAQGYGDLFKERERLRQGEKSPEAKARIDEISAQLRGRDVQDVSDVRKAKKSAFSADVLPEPVRRDSLQDNGRRKPAEPHALTDQVNEEMVGPTAAGWAQSKSGQRFLQEVGQLLDANNGDLAAVRMYRDKLVPKTNVVKGAIFDAIVQPDPATEPKAYQPELGGAQLSLGLPERDPGRGEPADPEVAGGPDRAGLADGARADGPVYGAEAQRAAPLTPDPEPTPEPLPERIPEEDVAPTLDSDPEVDPSKVAPPTIEALRERLTQVLNDRDAPREIKQEAFKLYDSIDPESQEGLLDTQEDVAAAYTYAAKQYEKLMDRQDRLLNRWKHKADEGDATTDGLDIDSLRLMEKGDLQGVLAHVADRHPNPVVAAVANRVRPLLGATKLTMHSELKTKSGQSARGAATVDGSRVMLRRRGADAEVVVHEAVHAATEHVLQNPKSWTPDQRAAVQTLRSLHNAVLEAGVRMPEPAKTDLSEFIAEALSNARVQAQMKQIPWKQQTAWHWFKSALLKMLGVQTPTNALEATLEAADAVFAAPEPVAKSNPLNVKFSFDDVVKSSEAYQEGDGPVRKAVKSFADALRTSGGVNPGTKFRVLTVDSLASVSNRFNALFDNAVRTSSGIVNPEGALRQAQDTAKLLLPFVDRGGLAKDPATGQYHAVDAEDSTANILRDITAWGEQQGMDERTASTAVSKMFEAIRLDGMRQSNATGDTDFPIHRLSKNAPGTADQQIDEALAEVLKHPEVLEFKRRLDDVKNRLVDQMAATGRISQDDADLWKTALDYVPFDRIGAAEANGGFRIQRSVGKGLAQLGKLPELVGSEEREVANVLDNSIRLQGWMVSQIVRHDAVKSSLRLLEHMGMAKKVGSKHAGDPTRTVLTYSKGKEIYFELPSRWDALAFAEQTVPKGTIVRLFGEPANWLRKSITILPPFAVSQVVQDIQRAFVTSGVRNPYAIIYPTLKNFFGVAASEVMGKQHPLVRKLGAYGVVGDYDINLRNPADAVLQDLGLRARGPLKSALHKLDSITRASDIAVRGAIYDQSLKEGASESEALVRAREFINFRRRGTSDAISTITATVPFFNAYLQGMDVLYRSITGKGASSTRGAADARKMFANRVLVLASLSAVYAICRAGDDDYEDADPRVKANNFLLPGGVRIPVAAELGAIFKVPVELALDHFRRQGTPEETEAAEATITAMRYAWEQWGARATAPIPAAVRPVLEAMTNMNFLTGQALEGTYQKTLDPSERRTNNTSELAMAISQFTKSLSDEVGMSMEVSPIKIDNFLSGYFGTMAGTVTMMTDQLINPDRLDRPLNKYWMLSAFMYDTMPSGDKTRAYELNEKIGSKLATLRLMAEQGRLDEAATYAETHQQELSIAQALGTAFQKSGQIRKEINWLVQSPEAAANYTDDERRARIDELRRMDNELFAWVRMYRNYLKNPDAFQ